MVTIRDVARESGVSVATVSYVLNNGPRPVRAETRERVVSTMRRLNYHPNAVARSLVRQRTQVIGILVGDEQSEIVTNNYYAGILAGVFSGARQRDYNVTFFTADRTGEKIEHQIRAQRPDAMLMIAPRSEQDLPKRLKSVGMPLGVVGCGETFREIAVVSLDVDNGAGMQLGMQHLWERGHRHIAYAMGEQTQESARARRGFYEAFLCAQGVSLDARDVIAHSFYSDVVYQATRKRLERLPTPTAIIAGNDGIALAVLQAVRDSGRRVPEDIAVLGYDDWPMATYVTPGLTTIRQPMHEIGEAVVVALADHLEGKELAAEPIVRWFAPTLVVRGST
jgi:DNA-binding LacI/PurR family transcriptional regulator